MATKNGSKRTPPKTRQFLSEEELSILKKKEKFDQKSVRGLPKSETSAKSKDEPKTKSEQSGIPINLETAAIAGISKMFKDASSNGVETVTAATRQSLGEARTVPPIASTKKSVSVIISKPDLKAIVSQEPGIKKLITTATQKSTDRLTTQRTVATESVKSLPTHAQSTGRQDKETTTRSVSFSSGVTLKSSTVSRSALVSTSTREPTTNTTSLWSAMYRTPSNIPLMVGGGLALFIIILLIAIVVLLVRLKNRKGDNISMRHEGSNRSNFSRDSEAGDIRQKNDSFTRRDSKDSNIYSEIGSEITDDDNDDDDDVIYYWGESEWDTDSRHNSVLSLSYTAKTEMARNSTASGLSVFGIPRRGRRKSSLTNKGRSGQNRCPEKRKDRQSGNIFSIPESEDAPIDTEKKIEIKKDDMYKKVLKEGRSQSLF